MASPQSNSDFYDLAGLLGEEDRDLLRRVRAFMDEQVEPIIISALIGEAKAYTVAYTTIGIIALASMVLTFITKVPADRRRTDPV
jgi:hypothetical protein